ncbi:beta-galactosidase [Kineococcus glutinatus]|uniref:Beta-galactosidase n=1 Tax=Kineococcus glutinatus TaxID=1070872 RepID=A0ABP9HVQ2_9ACTN
MSPRTPAPAAAGARRLTHHAGRPPRLRFGGDYNPEQWDPSVWPQDARLMREAGVDLVTVGVFSWAQLEPSPGERNFGWLDRVLDLLGEHGVDVDLATPTASPPPWLGHRFPETLPVDADGRTLTYGSRNQFCPCSPRYREAALAITTDLAERYHDHPAVVMWHVGNELGQWCHCDLAAAGFRTWLQRRHGDLDGLNAAWGTAFWSQRYDDWDEVIPPRAAPYLHNPAQSLDFRRFRSDALRDLFRAERDAIRARTDAPVTTNFMGFFHHVDYWSFAGEVDVVADDHYVDPADARSPARAALTHDLVRSLGGGEPWVLMEQAAGAVNWRPHNVPKPAGAMQLDSLRAVARGADAVCFFQWRQSRAGAERFHSAMLPHAGPDTRLHAEVRELGAALQRLGRVAGARVDARVALLHDWPSWWACEEPARPSDRLRVLDVLLSHYEPLFARGVAVDVLGPACDLDGYDLLVLPNLYLLEHDLAERLQRFVTGGGTLLVGPFSGVADADARIREGRFPALLRDLLGASGEEWVPLAAPSACTSAQFGDFHVDTWAERLRSDGAQVLAEHAAGDLAGVPAVTRRAVGSGSAWYCSVLLPPAVLSQVLGRCLDEAGVGGALPGPPPPGVEVVRRGDVLFVLNPGEEEVHLALPGRHTDLLTGDTLDGATVLAPRRGLALVEETQ